MEEKWKSLELEPPTVNNQRCLVCTKIGTVVIAVYCKEEKLFKIGKTDAEAVYWMPLPKSKVAAKVAKESICWGCRKADHFTNVENPCPWASKFQPVEGWVAEESRLKGYHSKGIESYRVISCPLFDADPPKKKTRKKGAKK